VQVGFWIPYGVLQSQKGTIQWRLPVALQLIPAVLCIIAMWFLKESPRFTAKKHGDAKGMLSLAAHTRRAHRSHPALEDLSYIRGLPIDHPYVRAEMASISAQVAFERAQVESLDKYAVMKRLFGRDNIRRLYTGVLVMVFFQMAGTNAVNYYSPLIFQSFGLNSSSAKLFATGVYGVVRFVSTLIAMVLFTDRFGRRTMLVWGGGAMAMFMWIIGALTHTFPPASGASGPSSAQIAAIVMIFCWAVCFCFSVS
jgi:MFS family permease